MPQTKLHPDKEKAEALKTLANELYGKKDFKSAYQRYTEAIKIDGSNAIYYANRAAASLAMQQFMNACADADKAIALDPTYAKGHARLAAGRAGLSRWGTAAEAWKQALALLPKDAELTPTERKLKQQFQAELQKAEKNSKMLAQGAVPITDVSKLPWHRAKDEEAKLDAELADGKFNSSGWVMLFAYRDFSEAVTTMKNLDMKTINGRTAVIGKPTAVTDFSNAIMRDARVFHIDGQNWFEKYNKQAMFEVQKFKAWSSLGPKGIMEEAPKRLRKEGWDGLRPAISITIRAWIMAGLFALKIGNELTAAYEFFSRAVELLAWGQQLWHDVPVSERGVVFERTFIRGVKRLKLEVMLARCSADKEVPFTRKQLAGEALEMVSDIESYPPQGKFDPGFVLSFWVYPKAEALATLGWYHMHEGFDSASAELAQVEFMEAFRYYKQASDILPRDEEAAFGYLYVALEALWWSGKSVKEQLPTLDKLDDIGQQMMRFWANSSNSVRRNDQKQMLATFSDCVNRGLTSEQYTLDSVVKPEVMKARDKWASSATIYIES